MKAGSSLVFQAGTKSPSIDARFPAPQLVFATLRNWVRPGKSRDRRPIKRFRLMHRYCAKQ
ncbi:hypothetical protein [Burkholderia gladioli]|uniref:hypothetical protein n=1 Tax=Burkholderia gladioli TaxID=28095 RepID=UPI00163E1197|nr:hypothetical protein [Burkholderia gladioli]